MLKPRYGAVKSSRKNCDELKIGLTYLYPDKKKGTVKGAELIIQIVIVVKICVLFVFEIESNKVKNNNPETVYPSTG